MTRPLAAVLLDLENTRRDWDEVAERARHCAEGSDAGDECGDELTRLDDRLDKLRAEFRARFLELTGVAWSNVDAAIVSGAL